MTLNTSNRIGNYTFQQQETFSYFSSAELFDHYQIVRQIFERIFSLPSTSAIYSPPAIEILIDSHSYTRSIATHIFFRNIEGGLLIFEQWVKFRKRPTVEMCNLIMYGFISNREGCPMANFQLAQRLFMWMLRKVGVAPNAGTIHILLMGSAFLGNPEFGERICLAGMKLKMIPPIILQKALLRFYFHTATLHPNTRQTIIKRANVYFDAMPLRDSEAQAVIKSIRQLPII